MSINNNIVVYLSWNVDETGKIEVFASAVDNIVYNDTYGIMSIHIGYKGEAYVIYAKNVRPHIIILNKYNKLL